MVILGGHGGGFVEDIWKRGGMVFFYFLFSPQML